MLLGLLSSSELIGDVLELVCQLLVLGFSLLELLGKAFSLSLLLDFLGLGFLGHSNKLLLQEFNLLALLFAADVDELKVLLPLFKELALFLEFLQLLRLKSVDVLKLLLLAGFKLAEVHSLLAKHILILPL